MPFVLIGTRLVCQLLRAFFLVVLVFAFVMRLWPDARVVLLCSVLVLTKCCSQLGQFFLGLLQLRLLLGVLQCSRYGCTLAQLCPAWLRKLSEGAIVDG